MLTEEFKEAFLDNLRESLVGRVAHEDASPGTAPSPTTILPSVSYSSIDLIGDPESLRVCIVFRHASDPSIVYGWSLELEPALPDWEEPEEGSIRDLPDRAAMMCEIEFSERVDLQLPEPDNGSEIHWLD